MKYKKMSLLELATRRERFIAMCITQGMSEKQANSDESWERFKHFCETGKVIERKVPDAPQSVQSTSRIANRK